MKFKDITKITNTIRRKSFPENHGWVIEGVNVYVYINGKYQSGYSAVMETIHESHLAGDDWEKFELKYWSKAEHLPWPLPVLRAKDMWGEICIINHISQNDGIFVHGMVIEWPEIKNYQYSTNGPAGPWQECLVFS